MSESKRTQYVTIYTKRFERKGRKGVKYDQSFGILNDNDEETLSRLRWLIRKPNKAHKPEDKRFLASPLVFFESYQIELDE